jgi:hypothetical protein
MNKQELDMSKLDLLYLHSTEMHTIFLTKLKTKFPEHSQELRMTEWPANSELE